MLDETLKNFRRKEYGNNGRPEKWPDRYYYQKGRKGGSAEPFLRYPKLDYTGRLKKSAEKSWGMSSRGKSWAAVSFGAPYAKIHNEGFSGSASGDPFRRPPKSTKPIRLGTRPYQRRFAGVGSRTKKNVIRIYSWEIKRLT